VEIDPFILSRLQFALNISFHILFPTISIGLCWILLFFRLCFTYTQDKEWEYAYYFWIKIFALTFAIGVVSGITMSFQFGTNWPGFMERAGYSRRLRFYSKRGFELLEWNWCREE
jgi:cytochrome d ubiquinol oxidase subunit I